MLPVLAEAAPSAFLDALERSLARGATGVVHVFSEEGDFSSPHTGLLWALERLGWAPERMPRVALALALLAEADPGGRLANRPHASMLRLLHPIRPTTNATVDDRIATLRGLHVQLPRLAWNFTLGLAGALRGGIAFPTAKPAFLTEACEERTVTVRELVTVENAVADLLLQNAGGDLDRWLELLGNRYLPSELRMQFIREAEQRVASGELIDSECRLWNVLRESLHMACLHHAANAEKPDEQVAGLRRVYDRLTPSDPVQSVAWRFERNPRIPERFENGWQQEQERLTDLRRTALQMLSERTDSLDLLRRLAGCVLDPVCLGFAIGTPPFGDWLESVVVDVSDIGWRRIRPAFLAVRVRAGIHDLKWAHARLSDLLGAGRLDEATEAVLLLPRAPATWDLVADLGTEIRDAYWKTEGFTYPDNEIDAGRVVEELLRVGAVARAADIAGVFAKHVTGEMIIRVLEILTGSPGELRRLAEMGSYHLGQLFARLQADTSVDDARVVKLEVAYLPALTGPGNAVGPLRLFHALGEEPELFAHLVTVLYRRSSEARPAADAGLEPTDPSTGIQSTGDAAAARNAFEILHAWSSYPGATLDGSAREARILEWSRKVLELASNEDRAESGEGELARVLARIPSGSDGIWPCETARTLIEERRQRFRDELGIAKSNLRGWWSKELYEGGRQEREIAVRYREGADRFKADRQWPETAAFLERMAERYECDAEQEDAEARSEKLEAGVD